MRLLNRWVHGFRRKDAVEVEVTTGWGLKARPRTDCMGRRKGERSCITHSTNLQDVLLFVTWACACLGVHASPPHLAIAHAKGPGVRRVHLLQVPHRRPLSVVGREHCLRAVAWAAVLA